MPAAVMKRCRSPAFSKKASTAPNAAPMPPAVPEAARAAREPSASLLTSSTQRHGGAAHSSAAAAHAAAQHSTAQHKGCREVRGAAPDSLPVSLVLPTLAPHALTAGGRAGRQEGGVGGVEKALQKAPAPTGAHHSLQRRRGGFGRCTRICARGSRAVLALTLRMQPPAPAGRRAVPTSSPQSPWPAQGGAHASPRATYTVLHLKC